MGRRQPAVEDRLASITPSGFSAWRLAAQNSRVTRCAGIDMRAE